MLCQHTDPFFCKHEALADSCKDEQRGVGIPFQESLAIAALDFEYISSDRRTARGVSRLSRVHEQTKKPANLARLHEPYNRFVRLVAWYDDLDLAPLNNED
jgi:hypothetical protein